MNIKNEAAGERKGFLPMKELLKSFLLKSLPRVECDTRPLRLLTEEHLSEIFNSGGTHDHWKKDQLEISSFELPDLAGGVNRGDQRAIYYLVKSLKPSRILETGTHIGCSTVAFALAQRGSNLNHRQLVTVDKRDVNDGRTRPWLRYRSNHSPSELVKSLGCEDFVKFEVGHSVDFLKKCRETFDFIFLDGDHEATEVGGSAFGKLAVGDEMEYLPDPFGPGDRCQGIAAASTTASGTGWGSGILGKTLF